jgi:hypothetical protein
MRTHEAGGLISTMTIDTTPFGAYLDWLAPQIKIPERPGSYSDLIRLLGTKEFVWLIPHDDNRIGDGLDVRRDFYAETGVEGDLGPCSVLEILVALSRRLSFIADGPESGWAWQLLCNLELDKYKDPIGPRQAVTVETILETLIWRTYSEDGQGGFFPLAWPDEDQRYVELWYQMEFYVSEIHPDH